MTVSYTIGLSGRLICHTCNRAWMVYEGEWETVLAQRASLCKATTPCGAAGEGQRLNTDDPLFIERWTRVTGEAPSPDDID